MGLAYSSVPVQDLSPGITPSSSNWITTHSRKAGLTIVEVQRLWDQFRQLGASSVTGRLNSSVTSGSRYSYNTFTFLLSIPQTQGNISFLNYCKACKNLQESSEEEKLRGIFRLYNDGKDWDYSTLRKLVLSVYPRENDDVIKSTTDTLMSQFTFGSHDYVTEQDFMRFMRNMDNSDLVESCLSYKIIPPYLSEKNQDDSLSDYIPSERSGPIGRNDRERLEEGGYLPSNQQLQMVATMMSEPKRDWRRLLNTLGFTESEISTAEESNQNDREQVLIDLLTEWRDNEPGVTEDLRQALMSTNNLDIANRL